MHSQSYLPAGFSDSDEDSSDEYGFSYDKVKTFQRKDNAKTGIELKKEKLLEYLNRNDLAAMKNELDHGEVKGFDIDAPLDGQLNLLYLSCSLGCSEIVQYLVQERGAYVNSSIESKSPLMFACDSAADSDEILKIVKTLIKENANYRSSDLFGVTPLMFASARGHTEVVKYLLSINDAIDAVDNEKKNCLFHAIDGNKFEIAKILIEAGVNINVVNNFGNSAKDYARNELQEDIVALFPEDVYVYQPPCNFMSYNRFDDIIPCSKSDV